MLKKFLKSLTQKGQVLVFYGLMIPTLFMFVGAAADFGWLYLNQSRLQNAADAAANAGEINLFTWTINLFRNTGTPLLFQTTKKSFWS